MIQYKVTADRMGITLDDLDHLLKGVTTGRVSQRLGVAPAFLDDFMKSGSVSADVARLLNLAPLAACDELAKRLTREGRIGLLVGLLLN